MNGGNSSPKRFSFSHSHSNDSMTTPFIEENETKDILNSNNSARFSLKGLTPTFPVSRWNDHLRHLSSGSSRGALTPFSRELESKKLIQFTSTLDALSLPDRIQLVKKRQIKDGGKVNLTFGIQSMDQSVDLEDSLFNPEEFSISFGGPDLLEFSFKKAEGIPSRNKNGLKPYMLVDHDALKKFNYKQFGIGLAVEGEMRRLGYVKKISGVFYIMDTDEELKYKIQKVDTFNTGYQKVFMLSEKDDVIGSLDLVQLNASTLACTVLFPPEIENMDKFLIIGTVFMLMWKISSPRTWLEKLNPSNGSYIFSCVKGIISKLCPKHT